MSRKKLEEIVDWIVDGNLEQFKADFGVVTKQFPGLDAEEIATLKEIQTNGLVAFDAEGETDVVGQQASQACGRSYGW